MPDKKEDGDAQLLGGTAIKPEGWDRTGWESFKYMLYDPNTGAILTRTPLSWLKITIFYLIYYSLLAGFWIACLFIFFQTLPRIEDGPKWQQDWGLIGNNPGVGLRPRNTDYRIDSQMFVLTDGDTNTHMSQRKGEGDINADYAERVNLFFKNYEKTPSEGYQKFEPSSLEFCGSHPYGYVGEKVTPCVYLKLNNIFGWEPEPVDCGAEGEFSEIDGLEKDICPKSLVEHLKSPEAIAAGTNNIWIDCKGRNPADKEALEDGIEYFPKSRALPFKYFPYLGRKDKGDPDNVGYHAPIVAAKISPKYKGQLIHIECAAYFRGVVHNRKDKMGLVQFEMVLNEKPGKK